MIGYTDLYEILRKEKYAEALQPLPKKFISQVSEFIANNSQPIQNQDDLFSDSTAKSKRQLENAIAMFKELFLRRRRKILNLVFVATETGITKRDFENMLDIEKEAFEKMVAAFEESDKKVSQTLNGKKENKTPKNKMILFSQNVEEFVNHTGKTIGPFKSGELANIDSEVADILVSGGKATLVDE